MEEYFILIVVGSVYQGDIKVKNLYTPKNSIPNI